MKIKILLMTVLGTIFFVSCNKDNEVDIKYQLTTNVDLSEMFKGIKDGNLNDVFTNNTNDFYVTINYLVYDKAGKLVDKDNKESTTLFQKVLFSVTLNEGSYTLVVWAQVRHILDKDIFPWISNNENSLQSFKIKNNDIAPLGFPLLGVSKTNITVDNSMNNDITLKITGACLMLNFVFPPDTNADGLLLRGNMINNEYSVETGNTSVIVSSIDYPWFNFYDIETKTEELFMCIPFFFLSSTQKEFKFQWGTFDGEELLNSGIITLYNVEQGNHRLINVNTETEEVSSSQFVIE